MKLYCKLPFSRISIDDDGYVWPSCCPDWVEFPLGNIFKQEWEDIWLGDAAKKLRASMYDGSLRYCKRDWCPNIADAEAGIENYHVVPHKSGMPEWEEKPPIHVNMNYDLTCNLKCPSCRSDFINYKGDKLEKVMHIQKYVEDKILPSVDSIALTGVGDPFYSQVFRNFLIHFDTQKYPNIKTIHFHTNGQLFDEKTYSKMQGIHHLNISTDISIDAASADVYNVVRNPGSWDRLIKNLKFIKTLDNLVLYGISMVVQQDNYKQMLAFIELGESLVHKNRPTFIEFKRIRHDGHLSKEQFSAIGLDEMDSGRKAEFVALLYEVEKKRIYNAHRNIQPSIRHNLQEYISTPVIVKTNFRKSIVAIFSSTAQRVLSFIHNIKHYKKT